MRITRMNCIDHTRQTVDCFRHTVVGFLTGHDRVEAADLAGFLTPEEFATPREGTRGKLGVA